MRMHKFALAAALVLLAPAALAQSSPAASQYLLGKAAAPDPRSGTSPCPHADYAACGYNARTVTVSPSPRTTSATSWLATGGQPSGAVGAPVGSTARCKDGTFSTEVLPQEACAQSGGVADWLPTPP
jgi:hypothetical protein